MTEILTIKITFGLLLSIGGFILILLSFLIGYKYLIQEKKCTRKVKGIVKKYTLSSRGGENSGIHLPIVYYLVDGKEYKVIGPEYKSYITVSKNSPFSKNCLKYEIKKQVLSVNRINNSFIGVYKNPIEELYPINSEIDVYYDPSNPKTAYVLRYCNQKWLFWLTFICGILAIILDIILLVIL